MTQTLANQSAQWPGGPRGAEGQPESLWSFFQDMVCFLKTEILFKKVCGKQN